VTNEERPEADTPQEPEAASRNDVLQPRALTARLARGSQFSTSLARTITQGPKPVLGNIASARSEPMLTVQSKLPPARPATVARTLQPIAREPEATAAPIEAPVARPLAPEPHDDGGIFGGIARFVLRRLKPRRDDNDHEPPAPTPPPPAPAASVARTAAAPVAEPPAPQWRAEVEDDHDEPQTPAEAAIARTPAPETTEAPLPAPIAREASDKTTEAPRFELARRPMPAQSAPTPEPAAAETPPALLAMSVEPLAGEAAPVARVEHKEEAPAAEVAAPTPIAPAPQTTEVAPAAPVIARVEASHEHETPEEHAAHADEAPAPAPILRAREESSPIANLALAIRRVFRAPEPEEAPREAEAAPVLSREETPETAEHATPAIAREEAAAPALSAAIAEEAPDSPAPMLARFAVLRDEASETQPEAGPARIAEEEPAEETAAPSFEAQSEPMPFTQRVMRFFRPRSGEEAAPAVSSAAASQAPVSRVDTPAAAPTPVARVSSAPAAPSQPSLSAAETLSPLTVARMQLAPLSRVQSVEEPEPESATAEPAVASGGDMVLRQASPVQRWDAGPSKANPLAPAPATFEIQREASAPLIYRRSAFAAPPSSAGGFDPAFEGAGMGVEQVLREIERGGMPNRQTLVASAEIIQNQLDGTTGGGGSDAATAEAPAEGADTAAPAASAAQPAAPAAAGAPADAAAMSNQVLEKLAREIFDRLRRRLMVERERAGIGTAIS
jgi:hypothetical protein